jgi:hypothetical protein
VNSKTGFDTGGADVDQRHFTNTAIFPVFLFIGGSIYEG